MRKPLAVLALLTTMSGAGLGQSVDSIPNDVFVDWNSHNHAGWIALTRGHLDVAEREFGHAIAKMRPYAGSDPRLLARSYNDLAWVLYRQGRAEEALPLAEWALKVRESRIGPNTEPVAQTLTMLAQIESGIGRPDLAEARLTKALRIHEGRSGKASLRVAEVLVDLGGVQIARRKYGQARASLKRVLDMSVEAVAGEDRSRALAHLGLADIEEAVGDVEAALDHIQKAIAVSANDPEADPKLLQDLKARLEALRGRLKKPEKPARPENVVATAD